MLQTSTAASQPGFPLYDFGAALLVFVQALGHPSAEQWGGSSQATIWSMLALFVTFSLVATATATWAWFRFVAPCRRERVNA